MLVAPKQTKHASLTGSLWNSDNKLNWRRTSC